MSLINNDPIENWEGYRKYKELRNCFIKLEVASITIHYDTNNNYKPLTKCIKRYKKGIKKSKMDRRLKEDIHIQLKSLLILKCIIDLNSQKLETLNQNNLLEDIINKFERSIVKLILDNYEKALISRYFNKLNELLSVNDNEELRNLIQKPEFHSHELLKFAKKLNFPKRDAYTILNEIFLKLVGIKAREVDPLNKFKKIFDIE